MDQDQFYHLFPASQLPLGGGDLYVYRPGTGPGITFPRLAYESVVRITSPAPITRFIEAIEASICEADSASGNGRDLVEKLLTAGILIGEVDILRAITSSVRIQAPNQIEFICIPTRNRSASMQQAIMSHVAAAEASWSTPIFLVCDSSTSQDDVGRNRAVLSNFVQRGVKVAYIGQHQITRWCEELSRIAEVPMRVVKYALSTSRGNFQPHGACRNVLLLVCAGYRILQMDDDICAQIAKPPGDSKNLRLTSVADPTQMWFFQDRESLVSSVDWVREDALSATENLLSSSVAASVFNAQQHSQVSLDTLSWGALSRLRQSEITVRVAMLGITGDSGWGPFSRYCWMSGESLDRLRANRDLYLGFRASGQIMRCVTSPTISNNVFCMSGALAIDNTEPLAPFPAVQRGEDHTFGLTISRCFHNNAFGFVPRALLHTRPLQEGKYTPSPIGRGGYSSTNDIISALIFAAPLQFTGVSDLERLLSLGKTLSQLGHLSDTTFDEAVRSVLLRSMSGQLVQAYELLDSGANALPEWVADVQSAIGAAKAAVADSRFTAPHDLVDRYPLDEARRWLKSCVSAYGDLLQVWPRLFSAAASLGRWSEQARAGLIETFNEA